MSNAGHENAGHENAGRKNELLRYWGFLEIVLSNPNSLELTLKHQISLVLLGVALEAFFGKQKESNSCYTDLTELANCIENGKLDDLLKSTDEQQPGLKYLLPERFWLEARYRRKKEQSLANALKKALKESRLKPYRFRDLVAELSKKVGKVLVPANLDTCCSKPTCAEAILALTPLLGALEALHDYLGEYEKTCSGVRAQISALSYYLFLRGEKNAGCLKLATTFNVADFLETCGCLKKTETGTYRLISAQRVLVIRKNNGKGQVCFGRDGYSLEFFAPKTSEPDGEKLACPHLGNFFPAWYAATDKCLKPLPTALYPQNNAYDFDLVREYHNYLLGCLLDGKSANSSAK